MIVQKITNSFFIVKFQNVLKLSVYLSRENRVLITNKALCGTEIIVMLNKKI